MDAELNTSEKFSTPWTSIYITGACAFIQSAQFSIFFSSMWPYLKKLDPQAEETLFGAIVALYSLGQCISAPTFGYWSNRIEQVRLPLLVGFFVMFLGNFIYLFLQYISRSWIGYVMMIARFISGSGTGNMSLLRAYASTASTSSDRSRAISCVSGGIAVGTMIGPAFQLFFTPLGEDGIDILSFYNLNIYNAPALFSLVLSILGYIIVKFKFEEEYRVLNETTGKVSGILSSPDYLAVGVCILTRFTQIFVQTTIETIGSAYSMMMFSFNKEEAVIYNSLVHVVAGTIGAILYLLFIVFDFTK